MISEIFKIKVYTMVQLISAMLQYNQGFKSEEHMKTCIKIAEEIADEIIKTA